MVAVAIVAAMPAAAGAREPRPVFKRTFSGPDGLITNAYATYTKNPLARHSGDWWLDGGSLFRRNNRAWTGAPSCGQPDLLSTVLNGSAKLRVHMVRQVPGERARDLLAASGPLHGRLLRSARGALERGQLLPAPRRRRQLLRGRGERPRRHVYIQKKVGGTYYLLAGEHGHPALLGRWNRVGASVKTERSGSVTIEVVWHGKVVLRAHDHGRGGRPITAAGRTGFRSDNTEFALDNFAVWKLP